MKQGDITQQALSTILPNQRLSEITKNLTDASVDTAYTGFGFTPRNVWCLATVGANIAFSSGMGGTGGSVCIAQYEPSGDMTSYNNNLIYLEVAASNYQIARILTMDPDGFTIRWIKQNSPTGSAKIYYMALT